MRQAPVLRSIVGFILSLATVGCLSGCADAPVSLKYQAKAAVESARQARAEVYYPDLVERAEESYRAGVAAMEIQGGRWTPARDYGLAEAHLRTAVRRANAASDLASARRRELKERSDTLLATAGDALGNLGFIFTYLTPRTRSRSDLMRARVLYQEARTLQAGGDLLPAVDRAEEASHRMSLLSETIARTLERYTSSDKVALYRRWVQDTVAQSAAYGSRAIIVDKIRHTLTLLQGGKPIRSYRVDIGLNGAQDKSMAGDKATPEGRYRIVEKRPTGRTRWYKALLLNYPNEEDLAQFEAAKRRGLIPRRSRVGGLIEIHGEGGRLQDWTEGCIALDNEDIDELYDLVSPGTAVTIVGYESDDWLGSAGRSRSVVADNDSPPSRRRRSRR